MTTTTRTQLPAAAVLLGSGVLNWGREERITDRYGFVTLFDGVESQRSAIMIDAFRHVDLKRGRLRALVMETRDSTHIGDIFHGIRPSRPDVGDVIDLCAEDGQLTAINDPFFCVGIIPDGAGIYQWLDVRALYRLHEQTVNLYFIPEDGDVRFALETAEHAPTIPALPDWDARIDS